jgi:hypothetical protein
MKFDFSALRKKSRIGMRFAAAGGAAAARALPTPTVARTAVLDKNKRRVIMGFSCRD